MAISARVLGVATLQVVLSAPALAHPCASLDRATTDLNLTPRVVPTSLQRITICHDAAFSHDVEFFVEWMTWAINIGTDKYGFLGPVTREGKQVNVYVFLPPVETSRTYRGYLGWTTGSRTDLDDGADRAELHYLTPSAPAWSLDGYPYYGSLQRGKEDYHAHYVIHEITHLWQFGVEYTTGFDPDAWIWEGLAEYVFG